MRLAKIRQIAIACSLLTKLLTWILLSPLPPEGPVGTLLTAPLPCFGTAFLTPPTGGTVALPVWGARRTRRLFLAGRPAVRRVVERISSRDWSSFPDMLMVVLGVRKVRSWAG
jgi:hypothetical protein